MKEEQLNKLREQDKNLRDAIRMDEAELSQMPADLNARLMQKVHSQSLTAKKGGKVRRLWPWLAAACVAGVLVVLLMPPRETIGDNDIVAKMEEKVEKKVEPEQTASQQDVQQETVLPEAPVKEAPKQIAQSTPAKPKKQQKPVVEEPQMAQETVPAETIIEAEQPAIAQTTTTTLSERDIPITRPENYQYTPEEIALMKKQANEAYLKWVELELEIAKYHIEQTAQN